MSAEPLARKGDPAAARAEPYLRIDRVSKSFDRMLAVDCVSLDVHAGEFVCILGPSGCGKTTLLRAIAGLDIQNTGRILQGGQDVSTLPASARDFGIVFQSYALFPNLTVERNVGYGLAGRGLDRSAMAARVAELLDHVGIADQRKKYPAQLSGGQQQRVALARALAMSPGLLLLDEPLSALDARVRVRLREEIRALQRRLKVTTIMVTHDQEEALTIADRIVIMNKGVIEQTGTPLEIYTAPASAFIAQFIGEMNFLPVTVGGPETVRLGKLELRCSMTAWLRTPRPSSASVRRTSPFAASVLAPPMPFPCTSPTWSSAAPSIAPACTAMARAFQSWRRISRPTPYATSTSRLAEPSRWHCRRAGFASLRATGPDPWRCRLPLRPQRYVRCGSRSAPTSGSCAARWWPSAPICSSPSPCRSTRS